MTDITDFFSQCQNRVDTVIKQQFQQAESTAPTLSEAMTYAVFNGGKRFRPCLGYACALALGSELNRVDGAAAAIELVHCYSLVHDDLPSMDDDDLRRGKPTCHKAFGEALAILAGDTLQAFAFEILAQSNPEIATEAKLQMVITLAQASGQAGMAAGQALDFESTNRACTLVQLEKIHNYKTGKIISACADLAAIACQHENSPKHLALKEYAAAIGLSFQVKDDILDIEGDTKTLGKKQGSDQGLNKSTYPSLLGLETAREKAQELHIQALAALDIFGEEANTLRSLSHYVITRTS